MANLAKFLIDGSVGGQSGSSDLGFDAVNGETLTLSLEGGPSSKVRRLTFEVFDANDDSSPLASLGTPTLTLDNGSTTGSSVDATNPSASVTLAVPATGIHAFLIRGKVNGGKGPNGNDDPDYVFERMVVIRGAAGQRKIVATEQTQYQKEGWAEAHNDLAEAMSDIEPQQLEDALALSVLARAASSVGSADWLSGTNNQVLRITSNAMSWGKVTHEMIEDGLALSFLGQPENALGNPVENIQVTDNEIVGTRPDPTNLRLKGHAPNKFVFEDTKSGDHSTQVEATEEAENTTLADAGELTLDFTPADDRLYRLTYLVTVDDGTNHFALDYLVIAYKASGSEAVVRLEKAIIDASEYSSPPSVSLDATMHDPGGGGTHLIRLTLTNNTGGQVSARIAMVPETENRA